MAIVEKNVKKPLFPFSRNPYYLIGTVLFVATWLFPFLGPAHDNILLKAGDHHALYLYQFLLKIPQDFAAIELRGSIFATMVELVVLVFCAGCILSALTTSVLALVFSHKNQHQTTLWFSAIAVFTSVGYLFLCLRYDETPLLLYRAFGIGYIFFFCGNIMFLIGNQLAIKKAENVGANHISPKTQHTEQSLKEIYLQFAQMISGNDDAVLAEVRELFEQTSAFLTAHQEQYDERCIDTERLSKEALYWISFADILIAHNYAAEFDCKAELEDFEYFLKELKGLKSYPTIDFPTLDENEVVHLWIDQINAYWQNQPIALMQQDIDSDSHVVFPINKEHIAFLKTESKKIGQKFYETGL